MLHRKQLMNSFLIFFLVISGDAVEPGESQQASSAIGLYNVSWYLADAH